MTTLTEGPRDAGFILWEGGMEYSRKVVTLHGGFTGAGTLKAGSVLGKLTSGGKYVISPNTGSDGSQTAIAVLVHHADISDGDVQAVVVNRLAVVNGAVLIYDSSVDDNTKKGSKLTQLEAVGIVGR